MPARTRRWHSAARPRARTGLPSLPPAGGFEPQCARAVRLGRPTSAHTLTRTTRPRRSLCPHPRRAGARTPAGHRRLAPLPPRTGGAAVPAPPLTKNKTIDEDVEASHRAAARVGAVCVSECAWVVGGSGTRCSFLGEAHSCAAKSARRARLGRRAARAAATQPFRVSRTRTCTCALDTQCVRRLHTR